MPSLFVLHFLLFSLPINAQLHVSLETTKGTILLRLYDETPLHRDNFLKVVNEGTYDGTLFHRVINEFMIQAGDPTSRYAEPGEVLGEGDLGYTVQAEFAHPEIFHRRGVLAAAREGDTENPAKASSACQFYIVTGKLHTEESLTALEERRNAPVIDACLNELLRPHADELATLANTDPEAFGSLYNSLYEEALRQCASQLFHYSAEERATYTTVGGTPHLDGAYTVFGEVVEGMDVVDAIQRVETDAHDRPVEDVVILKATMQ